MNLADLFTYTDIRQLQQLAAQCGLPQTHSKHELIQALLLKLQRPSWWEERTRRASSSELRFWKLLVFDSRERFNLEELLGKARQALHDQKDRPRTLVTNTVKAGLLFPGVSHRDRSLYLIPHAIRKQLICALRRQHVKKMVCEQTPEAYRDEQNCLSTDLERFLAYVGEHDVRLTVEGAIYRQDLQAILSRMVIEEKMIDKQRWRFGFGRRYQFYPDRFSLLYDYAYDQGYIAEHGSTLRLTTSLKGKNMRQEREAEALYHFWMRLYRRPIPALPLIVKWIHLFACSDWIQLKQLRHSLDEWLPAYYYMDTEALFTLLLKMLTHLGVIRLSDTAIQMTEVGKKWVTHPAGWDSNRLNQPDTAVEEPIFLKK